MEPEVVIYPGSVIFIPRKINSDYLRRQSLQAYAAILETLEYRLHPFLFLKIRIFELS